MGEPVSFLRMRPAHFPTVRLVQLAGLMASGTAWLSRVLEAASPRDILADTGVMAAGYWEDHFVLGEPSQPGAVPDVPAKVAQPAPKRLGPAMQQGLLLNAFIPLLYAYFVLLS